MNAIHNPRISLEQWRCFVAVVEAGGFAQGAEAINKSQSTVSYAVNKMQSLLDLQLLEIRGRKAELTEAGQVMYRRARLLLQDAAGIESLVNSLKACWEPEIRLAVDEAFPMPLLLKALKLFEPQSQGTRVQLEEVVLSGAEEALEQGRADLAIGHKLPTGFLGDPIYNLEFVAVAHPSHPLFELEQIQADDLKRHLQLVIRDSGQYKNVDTGWLKAEQRWTVSSLQTAIKTVSQGLGFAWLPQHDIQHLLACGDLQAIPIEQGAVRRIHLLLAYGHAEHIGPATQLLAQCIKTAVAEAES